MNEGSNSTSRWEYSDFDLEIRSRDSGDLHNTVSVIDPAALTRSPLETLRRADQLTGEREFDAGKYVVTARSQAGEAQEAMRYPFDEEYEGDTVQFLENVVLDSSETYRRVFSPGAEQIVQDVGQKLFEALLIGEVHRLYAVSLDRAKQQNKGLRLKLHIQPPDLVRLPWEFLYDSSRGEYLSLLHDAANSLS